MTEQYGAAEVASRIPTAKATRDGKVAVTIHLDPIVAAQVVKACDTCNAHPIAAMEAHIGVWFAEAVSIPKPWREVMTEQRAEIAALRRQVGALTRSALLVQS